MGEAESNESPKTMCGVGGLFGILLVRDSLRFPCLVMQREAGEYLFTVQVAAARVGGAFVFLWFSPYHPFIVKSS